MNIDIVQMKSDYFPSLLLTTVYVYFNITIEMLSCRVSKCEGVQSYPVFQNVCQTLWCSVKGFCRSKLDAAADGTQCGEKKVTYWDGERSEEGSGL